MKNIALLLVFLFAFNSCDEETNPVVFKLTTLKDNYDANIEVTYHKIEGEAMNSKLINSTIKNEFIKAIDSNNDIEKSKNLEDVIVAFDTEYKTFKTDFPEGNQVWQLAMETEVTYQSVDVISVALNTYIDKGGAHGNDSIIFLNFNPETGELFKQNDMIKDLDSFKKLAESYFIKEMEASKKNVSIEDYFFGNPFQLPANIGFSDEGIILLYNVYEIASYAQGYTEFAIPFEEAQTFIKVQ